MEPTKQKAKRKIKALDFSGANAAVALVSKDQGGAANGAPTLIIKAANFSDELVQKMKDLKIEMEIPAFIEKFNHLFETDVIAFAKAMGSEDDESAGDFIESNIQSLDVIKALGEAEDFASVLSDLQEDEYLALLQDQELLEKAMKDMEESKVAKEIKRRKPKVKTTRSYTDPNAVVSKSTEVALATAEDKPHVASEVEEEVTTSVVKTKSKETLMTTEVKVVEQVVETEMIAKAEFDTIQKAFADIQVELQKAKDDVAAFKAEKQEAITKAKKAQLSAVVKNEKHLEALSKAALMLDGEDFDGFVTAVQELHKQADQSELFIEKGATVSDEAPAVSESAVAKILKAKQSK